MTFPNSLKQIKDTQLKDGRVAILMRTKDRPILLSRAFASVLAQKYQNWHIYVVDDGGHRIDVEKLVTINERAFNARITVIHHETSRGMEAASNAALSRAEGEFIIVHDDDDSWHPEFLQKTVGFLNDPQNSAFAAVVTSAYIVNEKIVNDRVVELNRVEFRPWGSEIDFSSMLVRNLYPPISILIRKSVVDFVGEFNHQLPVLGDWDFNIRLLMMGDIGTIQEGLAYWHWRKKDGDDIYANSIHAVNNSHEKYDVLYRNSLLRSALTKNPEMMGVVQALGRRINDLQDEMNKNLHTQNVSLSRIEASLFRVESASVEVQSLIRKGLWPARWIWSLTLPFRKMISKPSKKS